MRPSPDPHRGFETRRPARKSGAEARSARPTPHVTGITAPGDKNLRIVVVVAAPLRASGLAPGAVGGFRPGEASGMQARPKRRGHPARTRFARLNTLAFGLERGGRAALLAGASTIAFAAFGSAAAWAACSNGDQTVAHRRQTGPVLGTLGRQHVGRRQHHCHGQRKRRQRSVRSRGYAENCGRTRSEHGARSTARTAPGGVAVEANRGVTIGSLINATGATIRRGGGRGYFRLAHSARACRTAARDHGADQQRNAGQQPEAMRPFRSAMAAWAAPAPPTPARSRR